MKRSTIIILAVLGVILLWGVFFYNGVKGALVEVDKQWGQVEVAYQARADKTKNLVEIVKGAANYESNTLKEVMEARQKAIEVKLTGDDLTPEKIAEFEKVQGNLSGAIGRLIVENYPTLQAVQSFRDFQTQYEGMENRIAVERRKFNEVIAGYNGRIVKFPGNILAGFFGFTPKEGFHSQPGTENAPDFSFQ